jgi:hypothetical protein
METRGAKIWRVVSKIRTVTAWLIIPAFISMLVAEDRIRGYPRPWPAHIPMPPALQSFIYWRNLSLLALVFLILVSIPRWQSLVAIAGLIIFFFFFGSM